MFGALYGIASANRLRLISALMNITGYVCIYIAFAGFVISWIGLVGIAKVHNTMNSTTNNMRQREAR